MKNVRCWSNLVVTGAARSPRSRSGLVSPVVRRPIMERDALRRKRLESDGREFLILGFHRREALVIERGNLLLHRVPNTSVAGPNAFLIDLDSSLSSSSTYSVLAIS